MNLSYDEELGVFVNLSALGMAVLAPSPRAHAMTVSSAENFEALVSHRFDFNVSPCSSLDYQMSLQSTWRSNQSSVLGSIYLQVHTVSRFPSLAYVADEC